MGQSPKIVIIAGPNGAGKSTIAPRVLRGPLAVDEFVNADAIALGLSAFKPETVALQAGRIMLARIKELATQRKNFALETTLASKTFAPLVRQLTNTGYEFHLVFVWLTSQEEAIARVEARVRAGGHSIPVETIRRRYNAGIRNFFELYRPISASWQVFNNSADSTLDMIARGRGAKEDRIDDGALWRQFLEVSDS
jgi:predicted ABC-type ATPase